MCKFKGTMAVRFGIHAAIIAQFIWDNIEKGSYDGRDYEMDGRKWCRCSVLMMTGFFPFLSGNMIQDAVQRLVEKKVIIKGCFNRNKFDRTNWYAFTDYGSHLMRKEGDRDG